MKKTILIGITSGIAAYKILELIKLLKKEGLEVFIIMTEHAAKMVEMREFEEESGNKVFTNLFEKRFDYKKVLLKRKVDHIELADIADIMVIVPATANIVGKIASGIADDFLTTTTLAITAPVIICPSMNTNMWNNPIVQENIFKLKNLGYQIIGPTEGPLACGYEGKGRLEEVEVIKSEIMLQLNRTKSLEGKTVIVTAGGTIERIDEVRFITNKSSGKMGAAIADECFLRGANVLLLRAKTAVKPRYLIPEKTFETSDELFYIIKKKIKECDLIFHTAAVSDFYIHEEKKGKISSQNSHNLKLNPRQKIVDQMKKFSPKTKLIAFKAEYGLKESELIKKALVKLKESSADAIVANDVSKSDRGFQVDTNEVFIVLKNGNFEKIPLDSKRNIASKIVEYVTKS